MLLDYVLEVVVDVLENHVLDQFVTLAAGIEEILSEGPCT